MLMEAAEEMAGWEPRKYFSDAMWSFSRCQWQIKCTRGGGGGKGSTHKPNVSLRPAYAAAVRNYKSEAIKLNVPQTFLYRLKSAFSFCIRFLQAKNFFKSQLMIQIQYLFSFALMYNISWIFGNRRKNIIFSSTRWSEKKKKTNSLALKGPQMHVGNVNFRESERSICKCNR